MRQPRELIARHTIVRFYSGLYIGRKGYSPDCLNQCAIYLSYVDLQSPPVRGCRVKAVGSSHGPSIRWHLPSLTNLD